MNKLLLTASALVLGLAYTADAWADCNGMYMGIRGGVVKHKIEKPKEGGTANANNDMDKNRFMMSGALGYRYDYFRAELEYVWRDKVDIKKTSVSDMGIETKAQRTLKSYSYMLNGYIDLAPYNWFTPYISAGIGMTNLKYKSTYSAGGYSAVESSKDDNFTWSVGGGLSVKVTNRFNVDAGYRFYDMGDMKHKNGSKTGVKAHEIYGGLRYVF